MAGLTVRAWRALVCIAFAVIVVAVVAVPYLGWMPHSSASGRSSAVYAVPDRWRLLLASFGDGAHGVVVMTQTSLISDTYMTANAGRTWQARHVGISGTTFLDRNHAIALESQPETQLVSTANSGRTWIPMSTPVMVPPVRLLLDRVSGGPAFIDPAHGWWLENRSPSQPLPVGLWRTRDGGRTPYSSLLSGNCRPRLEGLRSSAASTRATTGRRSTCRTKPGERVRRANGRATWWLPSRKCGSGPVLPSVSIKRSDSFGWFAPARTARPHVTRRRALPSFV